MMLMQLSWPLINTTLTVVLFIISTVFALYMRRSNRKHDEEKEELNRKAEALQKGVDDRTKAMKEMEDRLDTLEKEQASINAQVAPVNAVFQSILIKQLTHYHTPRMDDLLAKLGDATNAPTITEEEEVELALLLKERTQDMGPEITEDERDAAEIMPAMIRRVKREAAGIAKGGTITEIQVVAVIDEAVSEDKEKER